MAGPLDWTEAQDEMIRAMRWDRANWSAIAAAVGRHSNTVSQRGFRIGAICGEPPVTVPGRDPEPLPPGHPLTWGAITAGSCLDGIAYPQPSGSPRATCEEEYDRAA